jgi:hypothetical protein
MEWLPTARLQLDPSQSQSHVTTEGQSASLSWCYLPIWGPRPDFDYCQRVAGLLIWGALSDERTGLSFTVVAGPCQRCHTRIRVPRDPWPYFTVSDSRFPHPGGASHCICIPLEQGGPVIPPGTGLLFVVSNDFKGYKPKSELLYDWRFTANQFVLGPSPLRLTNRVFFHLNPYSHTPYVTSSLMRRWVCLIWTCLVFLSSVLIVPFFWGTTNKKYQASQFRLLVKQTFRVWTTYSQYSQRYFSRSWQISVGPGQKTIMTITKIIWNSWSKMAARAHRR